MILRFVVTTKCCSLSPYQLVWWHLCCSVAVCCAPPRPSHHGSLQVRHPQPGAVQARGAGRREDQQCRDPGAHHRRGEDRPPGERGQRAACPQPRVQEVAPVHITAEVRGRRREFCWTAKISPSSSAAAALGDELRLWERELFVYKELLPALELKRKWLHVKSS